jgi:thioredoxin-dependent peroxiredoxin
MSTSLQNGDAAPEISLPDSSGTTRKLSDFRGSPVVLFFFPAAFTPACTAEACSFRDAYEEFLDAGARVIGISGDSPSRLASFSGMFRLPFVLLSDSSGDARRAFGVSKSLGLFPGRVTYVLDRDHRIVMQFTSQLRPGRHIKEAISALARTSQSSPA